MPDIRSPRFAAWLASLTATTAICAPLWRPGYLLYRDAVATPRSFLTDTTLGIADAPPRAVPQDAVLALASTVVDGGVLVTLILTASLLCAGAGYGIFAARALPGVGATGAAAAAIVSIWNPFVAERLLQGHWSLLTAYGAIGWILFATMLIRDPDNSVRRRGWGIVWTATIFAAFTPTGSVLSGVVVAATITIPALVCQRWRTAAGSVVPVIVGACAWIVATIVGSGTAVTSSESFRAFAFRPEPGLGRLGTMLGLGGIWNADAVPASRTSGWAAAASLCLIAIVSVGVWQLVARRADRSARAVAAGAWLGGVAALLVIGLSTDAGFTAASWLAESVGGVGLLRDSQKLLMLCVPIVALAVAAATAWLRRWVPAGFALGAALLLIVAPLPDLAWGVGGRIDPISYPAEWSEVTAAIPADHGAVALWPAETVRTFGFANGPSLDPTSRLVRAPVIESGELRVDGAVVDLPTARSRDVAAALTHGDSSSLARLGVGWVLVSSGTQPPAVRTLPVVVRGPSLTLYRVDSASRAYEAGPAARSWAIGAVVEWLLGLLGGICLIAWRRR